LFFLFFFLAARMPSVAQRSIEEVTSPNGAWLSMAIDESGCVGQSGEESVPGCG